MDAPSDGRKGDVGFGIRAHRLRVPLRVICGGRDDELLSYGVQYVKINTRARSKTRLNTRSRLLEFGGAEAGSSQDKDCPLIGSSCCKNLVFIAALRQSHNHSFFSWVRFRDQVNLQRSTKPVTKARRLTVGPERGRYLNGGSVY